MKGLVFILIALGFAACDSASSGPDLPAGCEEELQIVSRPEHLSLYLGEGSRAIIIGSDSLSYSRSREQLTFAAEIANDAVASIRWVTRRDSIALAIDPLSAGSTDIKLRAEDACGVTREITIAVETLDICEASVLASHDVLFPVSLGRRWTYDYYYHYDGNVPYGWLDGSMIWEVVEIFPCSDGVRAFTLEHAYDLTYHVPPSYESEETGSYRVAGTLIGRDIKLDGYIGIVSPYDVLVETRWLHPKGSVDSVVVNAEQRFGIHDGQSVKVVLQRDVGIVQWHRYWWAKREWERREFDLAQ